MTIVQFLRVFNRNLNLFLLSSMVLGIVVFLGTRNEPKEYESETEIFTGIASGLNVASIENTKMDFFTTSNEYDNLINVIKSRQTLEEVGERLLVQHMLLDTADPRYISVENYGHFRYKWPKKIVRSIVVPGSEAKTLVNLKAYKEEHYNDEMVKLTFDNEWSPYSYGQIKRINVYRVQNSDLIKINYTFSDQGIAQQTLAILNSVFTSKLVEIKMGQSKDVVQYYRDQVDEAAQRLENAEGELQEFVVKNKIINYDEQTKSIATLKEQMEKEYQEENATKKAAEASLKELESKLALNKEILKLSGDVLSKRERLADLKSQIAQLEVYYKNAEELTALRKSSEKLEAELADIIEQRYQHSKTTDGLPLEMLLKEWLNYSLALDEANARLKIFNERRSYFGNLYDEYSPLGSEIDRMEREISIEERYYLELLNGLNQAIMQQHSETLVTGGLVVTVPPNYPIKHKKSKAMLLVLVAIVAGFMFPFSIVMIIEFLDNTVRSPERAIEFTDLKILGAIPDFTRRAEYKGIDMEWLREKSLGLMSQNTRLEMRSLGIVDKKPKKVVVFSTRTGDGKSFVVHELANELSELDFKIMVISNKERMDHAMYEHITYKGGRSFIKTSTYADLIPEGVDESAYDFIFMVFSSVLTEQYPINLAENADMAICVLSANRTWNKADRFSLKEFKNTLKVTPRFVLNGVEPDFMDTVVGEINKRRSFLRKFIKAIFTLQFRSKKF